MSLNNIGLGFTFSARDSMSHVVEKLRSGLDGLRAVGEQSSLSIMRSMTMSTTAIAGTVAALAAMAGGGAYALASVTGRFEKGIAAAGAVAGASAKEFDMLREAALSAGLAAQFTPTEATKALQDLASAGFNVKESIGMLKPVLDLAGGSLGQLSPSDAAGLAAQTMKAFGLSMDQAGISVDRLLQSVNVFALEARELPLAIGTASTGAQALGQSLSETLIALGLVKNVIPGVERASTGLTVAMERLATPKAQKALQEIGVAVADSKGQFRSFLDIINDMTPQLNKMTEAEKSAYLLHTFGHHALGSVHAIMTQLTNGVRTNTGETLKGADAVAYLRDQFENAGGTAAKFRATMLDTFEGQKQMLGAALETTAILLGKAFEGPFTSVLKGANTLIRGLIQLFTDGGFSGEVKDALDKNLGIKDFAIGIFVWVKRIQNYFTHLADSFETAFKPFRPVLDQLMGAFSMLGQALGLTGQGADENASAFDFFGEVGSTAGSILAKISGSILPFVVWGMEKLVAIVEICSAAWDALKPTVLSVGQALSGLWGMVSGLLTDNWKVMWDGFVDTVVGAANAVVKIVMGALGIVAKLLDSMGTSFGQNWGLNAGLQTFSADLQQGVTSGTGNLKSFVAGGTASPAVVAAQQSSAQNVTIQQVLAALSTSGSALEQVIHVHSILDGEKIAEAQVRSKRSLDARGFQRVPATSGGF